MAIRATRNGGTLRAFATSFNIPSSTLQEGISRVKTADPKLGRNSVFTPEQQESTAKHYTIIVPTKCTSLLKAQDITILYFFVFVFLVPTCFVPRGISSGGAMPVPN
jgi:hypothetical protein